MKKIKVLSLFNGMNCIGLALKEMNVEFELYASEIDKYANQVSSALFPETINLGDVTKINLEQLPVFDLLVAGSPCQGFSKAGNKLNFNHPKSKLFFEFIKILEHCKKQNPNIKWLLENVEMNKEWSSVISRFVGIDPIAINSALLSAQSRPRLYWTNIGTTKANLFGIEEPGIKQPKDKGIILKDILEPEEDVAEKYYKGSIEIPVEFLKTDFMKVDINLQKKNNQKKAGCLTAGGNSGGNHSDMDLIVTCARQVGRKKINGKRADNSNVKPKQELELRSDQKTNCLTSVQKDNYLVIKEATNKGYAEINDGDCFDMTFPKSKTRRGRKMESKSNCLTAANYDFCNDKNHRIRRLTPKECARLQTIPEDAIEIMLNCGVSDSQLYKMLGNGWTVEVIIYILKHWINDRQGKEIATKAGTFTS